MKQNSSIKEQVLHPEQIAKAVSPVKEGGDMASPAAAEPQPANCVEQLDERICAALHAASDKKALEMVVLDLREIASFTEFFLITSGTNVRQVQAIADEVVEQLKKQGTRALRVEGYSTAEWVLVDYGDFILHVFEDKARKFYDLERLWRDAARVPVPPDVSGTEGSLRN
jgi:ribosome-associated protein